ncbi:OmpH family outer membrane protein [Candidatus Protochlamydia phocaeensis]|uniref:OmpH family outer membrane protein n=1 Tax=Candidatus Protochlamydia phocaeensis TaxID=1414722 RepID=UPI000838B663|nr:OmpH family outer membrane protein [Candidatus Protochlamydia phocaeensis]
MKKLRHWFLGLGTLWACTFALSCFAQQNWNPSSGQAIKIGIVNTKRCLDESKLGKQEQANFEKMKNQMESILQDKERDLEEIESKLNDDDYMDSISEDAANELKRKKRTIRQEGMQLQNQYIQTLQQANIKIVQKLTDSISKASIQVAQEPINGQTLDVIFSDEACTFFSPQLDVTDRIIAKMNAIYDAEPKDSPNKKR